MNFTEAIDRACKEPTLVEALSWISLWECERVIPIAHEFKLGNKIAGPDGQGWDTCFKFLLQEVMEAYTIKRLKGI